MYDSSIRNFNLVGVRLFDKDSTCIPCLYHNEKLPENRKRSFTEFL